MYVRFHAFNQITCLLLCGKHALRNHPICRCRNLSESCSKLVGSLLHVLSARPTLYIGSDGCCRHMCFAGTWYDSAGDPMRELLVPATASNKFITGSNRRDSDLSHVSNIDLQLRCTLLCFLTNPALLRKVFSYGTMQYV